MRINLWIVITTFTFLIPVGSRCESQIKLPELVPSIEKDGGDSDVLRFYNIGGKLFNLEFEVVQHFTASIESPACNPQTWVTVTGGISYGWNTDNKEKLVFSMGVGHHHENLLFYPAELRKLYGDKITNAWVSTDTYIHISYEDEMGGHHQRYYATRDSDTSVRPTVSVPLKKDFDKEIEHQKYFEDKHKSIVSLANIVWNFNNLCKEKLTIPVPSFQ